MTDLWLISVPLDKASLISVEKLKRTIAKKNLASCCRFSIPELKVRFCITYSIRGNRSDSLSVFCSSVDLMSYVTKFQWDKAKYPTTLPLSSLADIINKEVSLMEAELRSRVLAYNSVKTSLQSFDHKTHGSLQTCSLNDIVRREDLVVSEYLTTLLVLVSRGSYLQWERTYESLSQFVVPRSSRKLLEDGEGGLFAVTLFKRAVCEFKANAQDSNVILMCTSPPQGIFVRWLKVNFSEVFVAWIHLKALRVFVESVLRYGLPVNYQALLLQSDKKRSKKLREELSSLFMHLDPTATAGKTEVSLDIPGICQQEYSSVICFHVNTNLLELS
uniref:V-type proton ATPase subunit C n=1 Tax=Labrus bergylta TaxID=56723 RepID=A0A3Q3GEU8_9LABR